MSYLYDLYAKTRAFCQCAIETLDNVGLRLWVTSKTSQKPSQMGETTNFKV